MKKIAFLAGSILLLTGCSIGGVEIEPSLSDYSYEELSGLENYRTLLLDACNEEFVRSISDMSFLSLGNLTAAGGTTAAEVMKSRTERLAASTGDDAAEAAILNELVGWEEFRDGVLTTDWETPLSSLETLANKGLEESLMEFFEYSDPRVPGAREGVVADLKEACGLGDSLEESEQIALNYETALTKLKSSFATRYLDKGFKNYGMVLIKFSIQGDKISFNYVQLGACSAIVNVSFPGKPDKDGLAWPDGEAGFLISHPSNFTEIQERFAIRDELNGDLDLYDLASGSIADVSCL